MVGREERKFSVQLDYTQRCVWLRHPRHDAMRCDAHAMQTQVMEFTNPPMNWINQNGGFSDRGPDPREDPHCLTHAQPWHWGFRAWSTTTVPSMYLGMSPGLDLAPTFSMYHHEVIRYGMAVPLD